jgi:hypothetical protein
MSARGELVRTSGLCWVCDFKFVHEMVARYPSRSMPGGWAYVELRHLDLIVAAFHYDGGRGISLRAPTDRVIQRGPARAESRSQR